MKKLALAATALSAVVLLEGCVTQPYGPTVPVMPAQGKSFADFQRDDAECQDFADSRVAGRAKAANNRVVADTVIGAALGTAVGAAFNRRSGAGTGAAVGGLVGAGVGANDAEYAQYSIQQRYDISYAQCMTAKGNQVDAGPGPRRHHRHRYYDDAPPPPPPNY
ncbi:MAG TPA: YMGG-like glycine zipper-containing protein [Rhizomicrobium sp.]|jgi:uncharacterized protein YcfJ|nr:YMGG-like glycine zipper-containing protein [Rhizomicrobium sp.]